MNKRSLFKLFFGFALILFLGVFNLYAQPDPPGPPCENPPCGPPNHPPVPISGMGYLLAIGGALGIKKIYDIRKNKNSE